MIDSSQFGQTNKEKNRTTSQFWKTSSVFLPTSAFPPFYKQIFRWQAGEESGDHEENVGKSQVSTFQKILPFIGRPFNVIDLILEINTLRRADTQKHTCTEPETHKKIKLTYFCCDNEKRGNITCESFFFFVANITKNGWRTKEKKTCLCACVSVWVLVCLCACWCVSKNSIFDISSP